MRVMLLCSSFLMMGCAVGVSYQVQQDTGDSGSPPSFPTAPYTNVVQVDAGSTVGTPPIADSGDGERVCSVIVIAGVPAVSYRCDDPLMWYTVTGAECTMEKCAVGDPCYLYLPATGKMYQGVCR